MRSLQIRKALPALAAVAALLMWITPHAASAEPPDGITIDVEVGYNGYVALASVNPVIVDLDNSSESTNLSGEIALSYNGIEYVSQLELPAPSRKRLYLYFPCDSWPPVLQLIVRTRAYSETFDLSRLYRPMEAGDVSAVVLTRQSGSLGVLNQVTVATLERDLYRDRTAVVDSGKVYVAYFDIDEIDLNPKFFSRAQTIIVGDIDYEQVESELAETLKAAAAGGSSVVFSLGLNGAGLAASPLAELCPLIVNNTMQTTDLGAFGTNYGIDASAAPATLAVGGLRRGAVGEAWAGQTPVVASMNYGGGKVTALAFDYAAAPFKQNPALAQLLVDNTLQISHSAGVRDSFLHPNAVSQVLKGLTEAKPISPAFVLLFLLLYIVLVGPANFLVLRRMKRRTLVWATIPVIIIAFAWFGLNTGYLTRGSDNVVAAFQELHVYPRSDYAPYQNLMLVFTAVRTNYTLEIPDRSAFVYADVPQVLDAWQFSSRQTNQFRGISGGKVDNSASPTVTSTQGQWTSKEYLYHGNMALATQVSADLTATHGEKTLYDIKGSFSIDLPFDLKSCYLFAPYYSQHIGDLAGQGTYQLPLAQGGGQPWTGRGNYLVENVSAFTSYQKEAATTSLLYRDEILLVGFTDSIEALADFKRPHKQHQLTMVVVHLPYTPVLPRGGVPQIARSRLVGGQAFERYNPQYSALPGQHRDSQVFMIERDGYFDVSYQLVGGNGSRNNLLIYLEGQELQDNQLIKDFYPYLTILVERDGIWYERELNRGEASLFLDISGAIQPDGYVVVRYKAKEDLVLKLPEADYSSTSR
jgi:hypothetical protein